MIQDSKFYHFDKIWLVRQFQLNTPYQELLGFKDIIVPYI